MTRIPLLGLVAGLLAVAASPADDKPAPLDPAKLVGDWTITEGTKAGEKAPDAGKGAVTISKDKITLKNDDMTFVFGYKVDPKETPAALDLEMLEPEAFGKPKAKGIVKLADGKLTLAYPPEPGKDRPKEFTSTKDNGVFLFVLKKKDDKKEEKK